MATATATKDMMKKKVAVCCTTAMMGLGGFFCLILFGLSIAEIVIGAKHLHECSKEKMIPIYLIVMGVAGILTSCGEKRSRNARRMKSKRKACAKGEKEEKATCPNEKCCEKKDKDEDEEDCGRCCDCFGGFIVGLFAIGWFIAGHVWVFKNQDFSAESTTIINGTEVASMSYCHPTLYKFAYWSIIGRWIAIGAFAILSVFVCCCACCFACYTFQGYECFENEDEEKKAHALDVEKAPGPIVQPALGTAAKPTHVYETEKGQDCDMQKI